MRYTLDGNQCRNFEISSKKEWLLTNGIGGYAMGTVSTANTRRYHGLLVAATQPPATRMVLLASLEVEIRTEANPVALSTHQYQDAIHPEGYLALQEFTLDEAAQWTYRAAGTQIVKTVAIHPGQNAVTITLKNTGKKACQLTLRPLVSHKFYHDTFRANPEYPQLARTNQSLTQVSHDGVTLNIAHPGAHAEATNGWYYRFDHLRESERGLDPKEDLYCPCELNYTLQPEEEIQLCASEGKPQEPITQPTTQNPSRTTPKEALQQAAEKFIVQTEKRASILAGYPWFTDWGRDTMISLPGLCLATGKIDIAKRIIRDYASQMKQGLIPNRFTEQNEEPEYNTVDATLWFANAIHQTLEADWDPDLAQTAHEALHQMFTWHQKGTAYGIQVDPKDGLLKAGAEGVQLTWMDAKIGDWVVTPRRGKPIEINALWINALHVLIQISEKLGKAATPYRIAAQLAEENFEKAFWRESIGHYLDVADPDDASLRPNQVIAMALPFPAAKGQNAKKALAKVAQELLTPVGLRTLAPSEPEYKPRFEGPLAERDAAYHQGTVWPWLMGPYINAILAVNQDRKEAKAILKNAAEMLQECGLDGIAEVYDAEEPRTPQGCPYQAWSVAEWLRAWNLVNDKD